MCFSATCPPLSAGELKAHVLVEKSWSAHVRLQVRADDLKYVREAIRESPRVPVRQRIRSDTESLYFENRSNAECLSHFDKDRKTRVHRVPVHADTKDKDQEAKVRKE